MKRRAFLKVLSTGALLTTTLTNAPVLFSLDRPIGTILYSAGSDIDGNYTVSGHVVGKTNKLLFTSPLPARAHGVSVREAHHEIVVFARRPNDYILVLDAYTGAIKQTITNDKPMFGHGVFSPNGNILFTTENDYENKRGVIGVRDASDHYKKIAEFPSGGIGPHELHLMKDGKTLVIANGGILTHPDTGRSKLNLDTMRPALTYIDTQTNKVIDDYRLDQKQHQLSIRHLDVSKDDQVCFVMQYQGSRHHNVALVGFHKGESQLQLAEMPSEILPKMRNYCGSVSTDTSGKTFAVSSPRGNLITLWGNKGEFIAYYDLVDGCGVAKGRKEQEFFVSNGAGELHRYNIRKHSKTGRVVGDTVIASYKNHRWDNHLTAWHL